MKRTGTTVLLFLMILVLLAPTPISAYSYGDANAEDVAETFRSINAALNGDTEDWKKADAAYQVRRSEIASHFGESIALTLDANIAEKNKSMLLANYKAVLVMNLDRRFTYAVKDMADYTKAKMLLTKAKATYEVLEPYVADTDAAAKALKTFDDALEALGNPGLFGVGQKDPDEKALKASIAAIYGTVDGKFPFTAYKKPEPVAPTTKPVQPSTQTTTDKGKQQTSTSGKTSTSTEGSTGTKQGTTSSNDVQEEPVADSNAGTAEEPAVTEPSTEEPLAEPVTEVVEEVQDEAGAEASDSANMNSSNVEPVEAAAHAPMERTDKTNPWVSISVIGGVIAIGGGTFFLAKKKGWI